MLGYIARSIKYKSKEVILTLYTARPKKKLSFRFKSANCSVMIWGCFSWSGLGTASPEFLNVMNDQRTLLQKTTSLSW